MAPPSSLMQLCEHVLASLLISDLDYWKQVQRLPLDVIHQILLCLPPLTLLSLSELLLSRQQKYKGDSRSHGISGKALCEQSEFIGEDDTSESDNRRNKGTRTCGRKRDCTGSFREPEYPTLELGISVAWKSLFLKRWPQNSRQYAIIDSDISDSMDGEGHEDVDWQQLYWEAHLQDCLNAAAAQASVSSFECQTGDILLPSDLVNQLGSKRSGSEEKEFSTLKGNCWHFARHVRKLRLQNVLCSPELVVLLKHARLRSIAIYNVRIKSDLTGLCQLLTQSMPTLLRLEFYYSKFSGATLNKIGKAICQAYSGHRLQHFALVSSRIFDQSDLFLVKPPDFLHFLCASRSLRSLKLWDNSLEQEHVVFLMSIIFHFSKNFSCLHLVDNELGEVFTRLLANSLVSNKSAEPEATPVLHRLTVLDLRSNMMDGEAVQSLAICLKKMPLLQQLNLSDNPLEDTGIERLAPYFKGLCNATSSLTELSLATCRMTATGAAALLDALSHSQMSVRRLSIASNHLGSLVSTTLAKFLQKCALETLDISDIGLGPTGCSIELEEAMISNRTLRQIEISKNRISGPGAAMLASVIATGRSALTSINASANLLSVDSITSIATALQSQSYRRSAGTIMSLDLRENPGSFLCKLAGIYDRIGACTVLLSDSSYEAQPAFHDDDP